MLDQYNLYKPANGFTEARQMTMQTTVIAINPIYQKIVNRFIKWDTRYSEIVSATDDNGGRKQEAAYDKAADAWYLLTARERVHLAKHYHVVGY